MSDLENLFLYGTLRHDPLLDIVAGEILSRTPAVLHDHAAFAVAGEDFPVILPAPGQVAPGVVIQTTAQIRARLDFYEDGFGYDLREVAVRTEAGERRARVYFAGGDVLRPAGRWSLEDWAAAWGDLTVESAREAMSGFGTRPPDWLSQRYQMVRARAWSRMLARRPQTMRSNAPFARDDVRIDAQARAWSGFFAMDTFRVDHPTFSGGRSGWLNREIFVGTDAALVLPYDPRTDHVLLVEQFRGGPLLRGDPHPWTLEPVAGLVDPGEDPADTARREAREEAGIEIRHLEPVTSGYPSPGATTEMYHCFVGLADLDATSRTGGLPEEGEDIRVHVLPRAEALDLVGTSEGNVIPLTMLLLWLDRHRDRLAALA
jgi:nudix-type nucleoside diphosphatase (YffH/AdpP family)